MDRRTRLRHPVAVLFISLATSLASGCGDSPGAMSSDAERSGGGAASDGGAMITPMVADDVALPPMRMTASGLLEETLAACARVIATGERQIVSACVHSPTTVPIVSEIADLHADAIDARPLPGRGLEAFALPPGEVTLAGDAIELISCTSNPLCMPGAPCPSMNAFALTNLIITLDPLLASFAEGAAYWGGLVEAAGGTPEAVDPGELYRGLGTIYAAHAQGRRYATVDEATVADMVQNDAFTNEMWISVTAFLIMHEIGHADLGHGVVNHTAAVGAQAVLMAEGRTLTPEEDMQLKAELRQLKVFTETQADIYAASLLRELGFSSDGPVVLFTGAMSAYLVASGACDAAMSQEQLFDCALAANPNASHPPLDVRATVLRRIVDDGEDLTDLLEEITPPAG